MAKYIEVEFQDGIYFLPVHIIAHDRATYYAEVDSLLPDGTTDQEIYDTSYNAEYSYTMNDKIELMDWIYNNINWEDICDYIFKAKEANMPSLKTQWMDEVAEGRLKVIEITG